MKAKTLFIASLVLLPLMLSCVKEKETAKTYRVDIDTPIIQDDGSVTLIGRDVMNIIHDECDCYFLCSSDKGDFSAASKISAKHGSKDSYTASYGPGADGTFYVKFCVDNMGLSYTESEVMAFEYTMPVDFDEAIDLGLPSGLKWAQVNLGAETPEEYGNYYAWGETEPNHLTGWSTYKWAANGEKIENGMSGYCASNKFGSGLDYKLVLDSADDAATAALGKGWRLPTSAEFKELLDNCSKEWDSKRKGYTLTSKKNGASIFLPAAGKRDAGEKDLQGLTGYYWSMNVDIKEQRQAVELFLSEGESPVLSSYTRWTEVSIRPVQGEFKRVQKVYLNEKEITLEVGARSKLVATFNPEKPTVTDVTWVGNTSIATVDQNGEVTAVGPGTATISAYSADGGIRASCTVNVPLEITGLAAVDLGLPSGLKWATLNVGASSPEKSGLYFALGDTEGQDWDGKSWSNGGFYKAVDYKLDNENNLLLQYDAAHVKLGGKWRMPTHTELKELFNYCSHLPCTINGVDGYLLKSTQTGYTDKYIFIPRAGYGYQNNIYNLTAGCYLWSRTYISNSGFYYIANGGASGFSYHNYNGMTIRAVSDDSYVPVTSVTVTPYAEIEAGKTIQLTATVLPDNASDKSVTWSSDDKLVATVNEDGLVTAVSEGTAVITATTTDGGKRDACKLSVKAPVFQAIDLGLSVKWANFNLGASSPQGYGGYYQWAGTQDVTDPSINVDWSLCPYHIGSTSGGWTKYVFTGAESYYWSGEGYPDNKTELEPEDDVARVTLGGKWRMPTRLEWEELTSNCSWVWTSIRDIYGYKITKKNAASTDNEYIFLPAAGYRSGNGTYGTGSSCMYWSTPLEQLNPYFPAYPSNAGCMNLQQKDNRFTFSSRYYGYSIRPVSE